MHIRNILSSGHSLPLGASGFLGCAQGDGGTLQSSQRYYKTAIAQDGFRVGAEVTAEHISMPRRRAWRRSGQSDGSRAVIILLSTIAGAPGRLHWNGESRCWRPVGRRCQLRSYSGSLGSARVSHVRFGWGTWIRTTTNRFRVCRPTVRRFPSRSIALSIVPSIARSRRAISVEWTPIGIHDGTLHCRRFHRRTLSAWQPLNLTTGFRSLRPSLSASPA